MHYICNLNRIHFNRVLNSKYRLFICLSIAFSQFVILLTFYSPGKLDLFLTNLNLKSEFKPPWMMLTKKTMLELMDSEEATVLIQPHTGLRKTPFAVIFVMSLPESLDRRNEIRESWYKWKNQLNVELRFFMGRPNNETSFKNVEKESKLHKDIVVISTEEKYYKLPMKVLEALRFFLKNDFSEIDSSIQPYFIKTDDDVFINLPNLVHYLKFSKEFSISRGTAGGGYLFPLPIVNRDPQSKFYVPRAVWKDEFFPSYVGGFCYIINGQIIPSIFETSLKSLYFPFEDVFLTGLVVNQKLGMKVINIEGMYDGASEEFYDVLEDNNKLAKAISITPLRVPHTMKNIYARVVDFNGVN